MGNINKTVLLLLLYTLFTQGSYCQTQKNIPDYLRQKFMRYTETVPREEIYIHTDRDEYIAGEDLWFNIYLIDRQSFKPSLKSRIAYFEILNGENRPVVQKRILIDKGFGPGQIVLPDSLNSGTYTIRAYTSWMKNNLPYNCFMKDVKIYNDFSKKVFQEKRYSDNYFNTGKRPVNRSYDAQSGLTFRINNLKADTLDIQVTSDKNYRVEKHDTIYIFIQAHGVSNSIRTEKIISDYSKISVLKKGLLPGINQITIFNSKGQPVFERYIYTREKEEQLLNLHSADSCNKRSKISLDIEPAGELYTDLKSMNFSISVAPPANGQEMIDMKDYMVFGTEYGFQSWNNARLKNIGELPPEITDSILSDIKSNWINWATILSDELPHYKYPIENEDHFLSGRLLTGDENSVHPSEYLLMCIPGREAGFQYASTDSTGNFRFNINIDEGIKDLVIMPDDINKNHKIIIESSFSDQYLRSEIADDSTRQSEKSQASEWSVNYQVKKIYGSSSRGNPLIPVYSSMAPLRFYGKPDIELIMADYISLPKMEEVFFELLPHVSLKKKKSTYEISIADRIDDSRYELSPCLMVDGVIIKDPSIIADLDPEIVEKIDVIKDKYIVGDYTFFGLVNVITKSGNFSCVPLPAYMIRLPYRVIDPVMSFVSPDYSSPEIKNNRIPDFRNTLYWNPSVRPDKDGKVRIEFWTSDVVSEYEINIQGIGVDGKVLSFRKLVKVE